MSKYKGRAIVLFHENIAADIYDMRLACPDIAANASAGQFVLVYTDDKSKLLPRPISICEIDKDEDSIRLVYRVTSKTSGTKIMSEYRVGELIEIMGPLGNGFTTFDKASILIGGGIGIPPMLELSKSMQAKPTVLLGYRDKETFLTNEFKKYATVHIATEDGSVGTKGNVIDIIKEKNLSAGCIMACGPTPMLKAVKDFAGENNIECFLSLEERMACGIGACLACVCKSKERDAYTNAHSKRVCKEGPVFEAGEIVL